MSFVKSFEKTASKKLPSLRLLKTEARDTLALAGLGGAVAGTAYGAKKLYDKMKKKKKD